MSHKDQHIIRENQLTGKTPKVTINKGICQDFFLLYVVDVPFGCLRDLLAFELVEFLGQVFTLLASYLCRGGQTREPIGDLPEHLCELVQAEIIVMVSVISFKDVSLFVDKHTRNGEVSGEENRIPF